MEDVGKLVRAAGEGDREAWDALVDQFNGLVWAVARGYRLGDADAADVVQTTWLRLVEHLGKLHDADRVGAWLATTARREALRVRERAARQVPTEESALDTGDSAAGPDRLAEDADRDRLLWRCVQDLPERCRRLLRVLAADPPPTYAEVSAGLDIPIGSIGPTRQRCLGQLREVLARAGLAADGRTA